MADPAGQDRRTPSVLLISMPWTTVAEPSLGLCLLKAVLSGRGIPCRVLHLSMFLLTCLRTRTYQALARYYALNDFLFSAVLDPRMTNAQQRLLRQCARSLVERKVLDPDWDGVESTVENLLDLRNRVLPGWLHQWADEVAADESNLIGLTGMFDQTIASLALARLVRERAPHKMIVLGGYAVRAPTARRRSG